MGQRGIESQLEIVVDGRRARVATGITVAAALFNMDVSSLRCSVSGEPRGPVCGMGVCFECGVTIDGKPHQRACMIAVVADMHIRTANRP